MADTTCVVEPLPAAEARVLRMYVEGEKAAFAAIDGRLAMAWCGIVDALIARGFLRKHKRGMLVTPEGLAAVLS